MIGCRSIPCSSPGSSDRNPPDSHPTHGRGPATARPILAPSRHRFPCASRRNLKVQSRPPFLLLTIALLDVLQTTLIKTSKSPADLTEAFNPILRAHGQAIVSHIIAGAEGHSPRSVVPHLAELLASVVMRLTEDSVFWVGQALSVVRPLLSSVLVSFTDPRKFANFLTATSPRVARNSPGARKAASDPARIADGQEGAGRPERVCHRQSGTGRVCLRWCRASMSSRRSRLDFMD